MGRLRALLRCLAARGPDELVRVFRSTYVFPPGKVRTLVVRWSAMICLRLKNLPRSHNSKGCRAQIRCMGKSHGFKHRSIAFPCQTLTLDLFNALEPREPMGLFDPAGRDIVL